MNFKKNISISILGLLLLFLLTTTSCTHDPILIDDPLKNPMDTIDPIDFGNPCNDDVVYFERDILPILRSNCAFSGCHDMASANDDVILENYNSVITTADVAPFNLNDSELYEVLVEDNLNKRMPPPPAEPLSSSQTNLVSKWILQGAKNLQCDEPEDCNSENVSFNIDVKPKIDNHCKGCHSGDSPSGGVNLDGHSNIKATAESGRLFGAITWSQGFTPMPKGQDKLTDCTIDKIKSWIDDGTPNN